MIGRNLPFADRCSQLAAEYDAAQHAGDAERARLLGEELNSATRLALEALKGTDGWQVVLQIMRDVVNNALSAIALSQQSEFHAGEIAAVENIRARLRKLAAESNTDDIADAYDEELTDE